MLLRTYFLAVPRGAGRGGPDRRRDALAGLRPRHPAYRLARHPDRCADHRALFVERVPDRHDLPAEVGQADGGRLVLPAVRPVQLGLGGDHGRRAHHRPADRHPLRPPAAPLHRGHGRRLGQGLNQSRYRENNGAHSRRLSRTRLCRRARQADRRLSRPPVRGLDLRAHHAGARADRVLRARTARPAAGRHRRRRRRHVHLPPRARGLRHLAGSDAPRRSARPGSTTSSRSARSSGGAASAIPPSTPPGST